MKKLTLALGLLMWCSLQMCHPVPVPVAPDGPVDGGAEGSDQLASADVQEPVDCVQSPEAGALPCGVELGAYRAADAIGKACLVLRAPSLKCTEGFPPTGTCEQTLAQLTANGTWDRAHTDCVAAATTRAGVRKCRVDCK